MAKQPLLLFEDVDKMERSNNQSSEEIIVIRRLAVSSPIIYFNKKTCIEDDVLIFNTPKTIRRVFNVFIELLNNDSFRDLALSENVMTNDLFKRNIKIYTMSDLAFLTLPVNANQSIEKERAAFIVQKEIILFSYTHDSTVSLSKVVFSKDDNLKEVKVSISCTSMKATVRTKYYPSINTL